MDPVYTSQSSRRPLVDGEGRRSLHFPVGGLARIPAHRGDGASVAFPLGLRISYQWINFYRASFFHRPMEAFGSDLMGNRSRRLESFCPLRDLPSAGGAKRFLSIQFIATACLLRCHFRLDAALHVNRNSDVPGG